MIKDIQQQIIELKREKDFCILAHNYMSEAICEVADFVGDSYALSVEASKVSQRNILMCGVRFMAETCKMLSPEKKVFLSNPDAACPMAEQFDREIIEEVKKRNSGFAVVAYINTTAQLKTVADVCVTSSSAIKICKAMPQKDIIFIPDINLGKYVQKAIPEKNFLLLSGGCPTHARVEKYDLEKAKKAHPEALVLVHPECRPEVALGADYVGSTTALMDFAARSNAREFIIGTENSIVEHLQFLHPEKRFYPLSKDMLCHNMRATTLMDVLGCLKGEAGEEIVMDEQLIKSAVKSIHKMMEYGG